MSNEELRVDEEVENLEEDEALRTAEPISYFGTDFDVHGLVRRLNEGDIAIPSFDPSGDEPEDLAGFQRRFVWKTKQMERFVETLLLGYPVPGIFLVQQIDKKLLVLDGQQRLRTLQAFYANKFELQNVVDELRGHTYKTLDSEARRALDNTFIHATVIKFDPTLGGAEAVYNLFERLNTGGTNLYPHEIRVALYSGALVDLIRELNTNKDWRALYGRRSPRLKDHELILRFLALYFEANNYKRPLKSFLNKFLGENRDLRTLDPKEVRAIFARTCKDLNEGVGSKAFRLKTTVNAALVDSVMVGVARRLANVKKIDPAKLESAYQALVNDGDFLAAIGRATADEERVNTRLQKATAAFLDV